MIDQNRLAEALSTTALRAKKSSLCRRLRYPFRYIIVGLLGEEKRKEEKGRKKKGGGADRRTASTKQPILKYQISKLHSPFHSMANERRRLYGREAKPLNKLQLD